MSTDWTVCVCVSGASGLRINDFIITVFLLDRSQVVCYPPRGQNGGGSRHLRIQLATRQAETEMDVSHRSL